MSTTLRFVKPEHASILREYLADGAVALFFDEEIEQAKSLGYNDEDQLEDYDFGGDPDSLIEHMFAAFSLALAASQGERS